MSSSPRKKRSELDKLLEAVDTSFHFETAAAERKRLSDSGLGPLEIDCSDTGSEASCNGAKRKASEATLAPEEEAKMKKQKVGNNLLKTASPGSENTKTPSGSGADSEEEEYDGSGAAWDGWELLQDQLTSITHSPVEIDRLHFSFETEPTREGWYSTYQRQDRGDEIIFYPASNSVPFLLPYEMPYSFFVPGKAGERRRDETPLGSRPQSKASSPVRQSGPLPTRKAKSRRVSECDSTDSEDLRRGRAAGRGKAGAAGKLPPLPSHLQEPNYRVSPRQHASTKSFLTGSEADGGVGELEDLAEAYIMRDEAELHFPNLSYLAGADDSNDSYSSESVRSRAVVPGRTVESSTELAELAASIDKFMMGDLAVTAGGDGAESAAKIPPTRSRISSDQLLSPKKLKKKKKLHSESVSPLDQAVADAVDPILLDLLEDELPTVPLEDLVQGPLHLLDTYSRCTSMAVCNKRWLKPSRLDTPPGPPSQAVYPPGLVRGTKRKFIYKDDLPGFNIDSDMEQEKMPISKRRPKEEPKEKKATKPVTEEVEEDSEDEEEEKPKPKKRGPSPSKKPVADPTKPKRIIIYKDDLPGFEVLPDSDVESEKLPVSKRGGKPGPKPGKKKAKVPKSAAKVQEDEGQDEEEDEEDTVSVDSFSSTSSG
jgi:hypothetical protein